MAWTLSTYTSNSVNLRFGSFKKPEAKEIKNRILFLPGRGEYIEKYNFLTETLEIDTHTELLIIDHRGQGFSSDYPFHIHSYEIFCDDVKNLFESLAVKDSYSIVAFSMGGLISLYGALKGFFSPERLFLACPLLGLPKTRSWYTGVFAVSGLLHFVGLGKKRWRKYKIADRFEDNLLTLNEDHYESLKKPLRNPEEGSFSWIYATLRAMFYVNKVADLKKLKAKVVFCAVSQEEIVSNVAIYNFMKKMQSESSQSITSLFLFQGKHEIFFEKVEERNRFLSLLNSWIYES